MKGGTMYEQKDIVLMPFPYSDLTSSKLRPALIISNNKLNKTEDRICVLVTSMPSDNGILIEKDSFISDKLPFKSWVKPHRIFTINEKIIKKKLCSININLYKKVLSEVLNYIQN